MQEQDYRLYEPDFENITTIHQIKTLIRACHIKLTFDLNNKDQKLEVDNLLDNKIIKEVKATIKTNDN